MSLHYCKECQGCGRLFRRNRARKRHILGHSYTYYEAVGVNNDGSTFLKPKRKDIPPCPMLGDNYRHEAASFYTLKRVHVEVKLKEILDR